MKWLEKVYKHNQKYKSSIRFFLQKMFSVYLLFPSEKCRDPLPLLSLEQGGTKGVYLVGDLILGQGLQKSSTS